MKNADIKMNEQVETLLNEIRTQFNNFRVEVQKLTESSLRKQEETLTLVSSANEKIIKETISVTMGDNTIRLAELASKIDEIKLEMGTAKPTKAGTAKKQKEAVAETTVTDENSSLVDKIAALAIAEHDLGGAFKIYNNIATMYGRLYALEATRTALNFDEELITRAKSEKMYIDNETKKGAMEYLGKAIKAVIDRDEKTNEQYAEYARIMRAVMDKIKSHIK